MQDADTLGTLLLTDLWAAARERGKNKPNQKPFYVFVDEFQRFITPDIAESLAEARGFGLHITAANQFPGQLLDEGDAGKKLYKGIMENARSKAVFQLSDEENLQLLARWLFRGSMNPDEIRLALKTTKVIGYRQEQRQSFTTGKSRSQGGGSGRSRGSNSSRGETVHEHLRGIERDEDLLVTDGEGRSESTAENSSWGESESDSVTEQTVDVPILGRELSSVQFRSLDEQLHRAIVALFDQQQRHCVVRLEGMKVPIAIRVPNVPDIHLPAEQVEGYRLERLSRLPFALRRAEAVSRIESRQKLLLTKALGDLSIGSDDTTYGRRLE
jgi:hypothetical protein